MAYAQIAAAIGSIILDGVAKKQQAKRVGNAALTTGSNLLQQASDIETIGGLDELEFRADSATELSSIESQFADAGIGFTGSVIDVLLASKRRLETDALKIRETTRRAAKSSTEQAGQSLQEAKFAKEAEKKSFFGLFG